MGKQKIRVTAGKRSRTKGKTHENDIAKKFNTWAELPNNEEGSFRRRWSGRGETRTGGDLIVPDWFPFIIECRHRKGWSFQAILKNGVASPLIKWWRELREKNYSVKMFMVFREQGGSDYVMFGGDELEHLLNDYDLPHDPLITIKVKGCTKLYVMRFDMFLEWLDPESFRRNS